MRFIVALTALPCLALGACDSDSGAPASFNASASDSTVVNTLDDAGRQKLCDEVVTFGESAVSVTEMKRLSCYGLALAFSAGESCEATAQACMKAEPTESESETTSSCNSGEFDNCTATIAEIESCLNARIAASKALAAKISCAADEDAMNALAEPAESACAPVEAKCPSLAEGGEAPVDNGSSDAGSGN